jgi:hypothetical protein
MGDSSMPCMSPCKTSGGLGCVRNFGVYMRSPLQSRRACVSHAVAMRVFTLPPAEKRASHNPCCALPLPLVLLACCPCLYVEALSILFCSVSPPHLSQKAPAGDTSSMFMPKLAKGAWVGDLQHWCHGGGVC